ncbi:peptidylprolyl isomerase [Mucilaginibacter sp.]|uniref:peptidylprolyl isomerase n=1 Tax=Mucilaginibacter sp. TaxID=1882438 RepID=UPI0035BC2484
MKQVWFILLMMAVLSHSGLAQTGNQYIKLETPQGWCIIKLYNETPVHRYNFIRLVKSGYFNKTTFNRIIKNFVIQGGDPDSLYEKPHVLKPEQKWMASELNANLFHKRGAVAMGRDDNPAQSSFTTQFYIVDGKKRTAAQLDTISKKSKVQFTGLQRQVYQETGGTPSLDQHYTVFGEIVKGIELVDKITALNVDKNGNPDAPVRMKLTLLKSKEATALLKQ